MLYYTRRLWIVAGMVLLLSGCGPADLSENLLTEDAKVAEDGLTAKRLKQLPTPRDPIVLAVYAFNDKTGQHKPSDNFPEYSRAVTQGGTDILNKALYDAGSGSWFRVLEREGLNNLVQERKIIRATRQEYSAGNVPEDVGPLLYAGMLLEGGIVAYDTNVVTGGAGARYLGVGGDTQYRRDIVTVSLRAISVRTGEVILAVNTSKTIFSTMLRGGINKFIAIDELLEVETGFSLNEAPQYAVRQAIEMAVYSMVIEGAIKGLWSFADPVSGDRVIRDYLSKRDRLSEDDPGLRNPKNRLSDQPVTAPIPPAAAAPAPVRAAPAPVQAPTPVPNSQVAPAAPAQSVGALPPITPPRYQGSYRAPRAAAPTTPVLKQLPADAKPNPQAKPLIKSTEPNSDDPQNIETLERYEQQGVVYCGPSGCVPAYDAPPGQ